MSHLPSEPCGKPPPGSTPVPTVDSSKDDTLRSKPGFTPGRRTESFPTCLSRSPTWETPVCRGIACFRPECRQAMGTPGKHSGRVASVTCHSVHAARCLQSVGCAEEGKDHRLCAPGPLPGCPAACDSAISTRAQCFLDVTQFLSLVTLAVLSHHLDGASNTSARPHASCPSPPPTHLIKTQLGCCHPLGIYNGSREILKV